MVVRAVGVVVVVVLVVVVVMVVGETPVVSHPLTIIIHIHHSPVNILCKCACV